MSSSRMEQMMSETIEEVKATPAEMIKEYMSLRTQKKQFEDAVAAKSKELYEDRMEAITNTLLGMLNEMGLDNFKANEGTAMKKISYSATIADGREFRRHVIGLEAWDLADWRANPVRIRELVEAGEPLPPGVNFTSRYVVQIRKA